jgi:hypothetical protein
MKCELFVLQAEAERARRILENATDSEAVSEDRRKSISAVVLAVSRSNRN